jgi:hypothetical protein
MTRLSLAQAAAIKEQEGAFRSGGAVSRTMQQVLRLAAPASEAMTHQVVAIDGSLGLAGLLLTLRMVKRNGDDRTSTHLVYGPAVQARQPIEGMAGPGAKQTFGRLCTSL